MSSTGNGPVHLGMHLALLASEQFHIAKGRWPGSAADDQVDSDAAQLDQTVLAMVKEAKPNVEQLGESPSHSIKEVYVLYEIQLTIGFEVGLAACLILPPSWVESLHKKRSSSSRINTIRWIIRLLLI